MICKWDYNTSTWNDEELEKILNIISYLDHTLYSECFNQFSTYIKKYYKISVKEYIQKYIKKDITETEFEDYPGVLYKDIINAFNGAIEKLEAISGGSFYSEELKRIQKRHELFEDCERTIGVCTLDGIIEELNNLLTKKIVNNLTEISNIVNELINIVNKSASKDYVLGRFCSNKKIDDSYIVIYMKTINEYNGKTYKDILVEETIAHELFHAVHYYASDNNIRKTWCNKVIESYKIRKKAVKESLADYFAGSYLEYDFSLNANNLYEEAIDALHANWKRHSFPEYPYSGAQYLFTDNNTSDPYISEYSKISNDTFFNILYNAACHEWSHAYKCIEIAANEGPDSGLKMALKIFRSHTYLCLRLFPEILNEHNGYREEMIYDFCQLVKDISGNDPDVDRMPYWTIDNYDLFYCELKGIYGWERNHKNELKDIINRLYQNESFESIFEEIKRIKYSSLVCN